MACYVKVLWNFFKNLAWISPENLPEIGQAGFVDTLEECFVSH